MAADPRQALADRVYYGWVVAAACFLASMALFGTSYAFGVFYDSFLAEFDASRTALAAAFGIQTALIYVVGVPAGRLVDAYGQRIVAAGAGLVLTAGLLWTSFARSYAELLLAFGVVSAVGMAGLYVVAYATVPLWFKRRRGAASGLASSGLGFGLIVVPPLADRLIGTVGWRGAMLAVTGTVGVICGLVVLLFADRPADVGADTSVEFATGDSATDDSATDDSANDGSSNDDSANDGSPNDDAANDGSPSDEPPVFDEPAGTEPAPEQAGSVGDEGPSTADRPNAVASANDEARGRYGDLGGSRDVRETLRSRAFLLVLVGWTLAFVPLFLVMSHVVLHATDVGLDRSVGVRAITVVGVTTAGSRLAVGVLSDRLGRTRSFVACAALLGVATALLAVVPNATAFLATVALFGIAYGGCGGLIGPQIADLFGERSLNTLFAAASLSFAVAGLLAPPLAGYAFETLGSYTLALLFAGIGGVIGAGCVAFASRLV